MRALVSGMPGARPSARASGQTAASTFWLPTLCAVTSAPSARRSTKACGCASRAQRAPGRQPPPRSGRTRFASGRAAARRRRCGAALGPPDPLDREVGQEERGEPRHRGPPRASGGAGRRAGGPERPASGRGRAPPSDRPRTAKARRARSRSASASRRRRARPAAPRRPCASGGAAGPRCRPPRRRAGGGGWRACAARLTSPTTAARLPWRTPSSITASTSSSLRHSA